MSPRKSILEKSLTSLTSEEAFSNCRVLLVSERILSVTLHRFCLAAFQYIYTNFIKLRSGAICNFVQKQLFSILKNVFYNLLLRYFKILT